jgi:Fe2+-dicitrate sensor, membrane component
MSTRDYYFTLIHKALTQRSSEKEQKELQNWMASDPDNQRIFDDISEIWNNPVEDDLLSEVKFIDGLETLSNNIKSTSSVEKAFRRNKWIAAIAIIIAIFLLMLNAFQYYYYDFQHPYSYTFIQDSNTVRLPDRSLITLHENAKLISRFTSNQRSVALTGMARFDIKKEDRPFTVYAGDVVIRVIGTTFFLRDGNPDGIEILVTNGVVDVQFKEARRTVSAGEYLSVKNDSCGQISSIPPTNFDAWYTRKLQFEKTALKDVAIALEEYYKVNITLGEPIEKCRFTGSFHNLRLEEVFGILEYSMDIEFEKVSSSSYYVAGKGCAPK